MSPPAPYDGFDRQPIGGSWRHGSGKATIRDEDPYRGETILEIPSAGLADLDVAYATARVAQPAWAASLPTVRATVLRRAACIMRARRGEIVDWLIRESGSTRLKAEMEWSAVHAVMLESASMPYRVEGRILPGDVTGKEFRVYRGPVGVVGVISPWNWPLQLTARSLAPALAVGNAVVVKPASDTPVTGGLLLAKILEEAGLPEGVFSVVAGAAREIGDAFVLHPVPRVISFTGSTGIGRHVAMLAVQSSMLKRTELELGGNGSIVVLEDADLDQAASCACFGKFLHQGQICMIANRLIVTDAVYDAFLDRFIAYVRGLRVGDPADPSTMIGPLINRRQRDALLARIRLAREAGTREVLGGEPRGLVVPPHVFADVANDSPLAQEELFGPVAPVIRAADEEEALRFANATQQGLSGAVFTRDLERGVRFARRLAVGMAHVNDHPVHDLPNNPFGGEKNSGFGRFGGDWAITAFTTDQWVTLQHEPASTPF
ncbi:4-hydroxybenzaldehyde dehydrogenase (NADP(+)) [Rhodovastum atsumiense]|uniref:Aldehyde dehydrogenase family protein n=1 Tax=Rhodovastum atsumiense TaxID=504468 RepID=A0A5M6IPG8_9PROT|nr:aldehyde dehydrogenase family protein [Rhodovastum atsumiense]KAA5609365.1 aldehyde dehydrogenase family protein [Rhodovastum atsumiense]CAH2598577.1 4-hydroxybenzaldehyde dehydrogenase (NADP(+)) [Rhodovastum atsumiense]